MTAQMPDIVEYKKQEFALTGIDGEGFFDPADYGMEPRPVCTACWRGFMANYRVKDNELQLNELRIALAGPRKPENGPQKTIPAPVLGGYSAIPCEDGELDIYENFENMSLLVPFTGGLLLGDEFIEDLYVHQGFHPAWKFKIVHELLFENGRLVGEADVSEKIAAVRVKMKKEGLRPQAGGGLEEHWEWIAQCFSLDYNW